MALFHLPRVTKGYGIAYISINNQIALLEAALNDSVNNIQCFAAPATSNLVGGVWNKMLLGNVTLIVEPNVPIYSILEVWSPSLLTKQIVGHSELSDNTETWNWRVELVPEPNKAEDVNGIIMIKHRLDATRIDHFDFNGSTRLFFQTILR